MHRFSNEKVPQRNLFEWVGKLKHMVIKDDRTEKQKFIDGSLKKLMKESDDKIEAAFKETGKTGLVVWTLKLGLKLAAKGQLKQLNHNMQMSTRIRSYADQLIVNDAVVKNIFGRDVTADETKELSGEQSKIQKLQKEYSVKVALSGSSNTGFATIYASRSLEGFFVTKITIVDSREREFDLSLAEDSEETNMDAMDLDAKVSGVSKDKIIDVKAKD
jgi:G:T-mismatch repair DNA endonuclease (very short patch repair protein)